MSSGLPAAACAGDASSLVSFTQSAITYDSATKLYDQTVTVTNISSAAIKGPISLLVEDLSAGATLVNAKGATTCDDPGTPYVAKGSPLAAGQTDTFVLHFADPSQQGITWTAGVTAEGSP